MAIELQRRIVERSWKTGAAQARYMGALMPPVYWQRAWLEEALADARLAGVRAGIEAAVKDAEFQRDELPGLLHGSADYFAFDVCIHQRIEDAKAYIERFEKLDAAKIAQESDQ